MATTYAIPDGRVAMAATLWTGNNATQSISNAVNGVSFQPDMIWSKIRNQAYNHKVDDVIRGVEKDLYTNSTSAEVSQPNGMTSFNSNGFSVGSDSAWNYNGGTFVAWQWKGGGTAVSNTAGSITSSVSANPTAGFSVVTWTGTGSNATVGHGLGVAPAFIIGKKRSAAGSWQTYVSAIPNMATGYIVLNGTGAWTSNSTIWNGTAPTSTVFSLGTDTDLNANGATNVAYCFAPVAGYSAFGRYTGNGSADGPFVYLGFRPRFVMFKNATGAGNSWVIFDTSRTPSNQDFLELKPESAGAESPAGSYAYFDFLSNGFKVRTTSTAENASGQTIIYMAFAENPFKYANAR